MGATVILIYPRHCDVADLIDESYAAGFIPKSDLAATTIRQLVAERGASG